MDCRNCDFTKLIPLKQSPKYPVIVPDKLMRTPSTSSSITNLLDLPLDVTANILHRVGPIDILVNVQRVCTTWHKICKDPSMWRVIDMHNPWNPLNRPYDLVRMCMHAVDRSEGQLVDINIEEFCTKELIEYIADRSNQLRRLRIAFCFNVVHDVMSKALEKFPLLEELNLLYTEISKEHIEVAGRCCPRLKSLKWNGRPVLYQDLTPELEPSFNKEAIAIGENLQQLRHIQLIGNSMTNIGLKAILDGCTNLESLDLRRCPYIDLDLDEVLGKRCSEQIKFLRLPAYEDCRSGRRMPKLTLEELIKKVIKERHIIEDLVSNER